MFADSNDIIFDTLTKKMLIKYKEKLEITVIYTRFERNKVIFIVHKYLENSLNGTV